MSGHEWTKHERDGWSVCSRCGMVRNYDRELTTCSGALPKIRQRSEIEDCGQDGVCRLSPGCNRHWEERNRELVRERDAAIARAEQAERERDELRERYALVTRIRALQESQIADLEARVQELEAALREIAAIDSASPEHRIAMRALWTICEAQTLRAPEESTS